MSLSMLSNAALLGIMGLGPMELAIFAVVVLLLFGHRLPSVMRSLGTGIVEFKKGVKGMEDDIDQASSKPKLDDAAGKKAP